MRRDLDKIQPLQKDGATALTVAVLIRYALLHVEH